MRVLVTGASGFIGNALCSTKSNEIQFIPLVRSASGSDLMEFRVTDGSFESLKNVLEGVDIVVHLATCYVAEHTPDDIPRIINSNIEFGTLLLEAMREMKVTRIVNIGTTWQKFRSEDHRYGNLYAATKQSFQEILSWYCDANSFSAINLHLSDTYGPNDTRRKILQLLINTSLSGKNLDMSEGMQKLELTHVQDVVEAILESCRQAFRLEPHENHEYSALTGKEISLRELVGLVSDVLGRPININWGGRPYRMREVMETPYNSYKTLPNWSPKITLEQGLKDVCQ